MKNVGSWFTGLLAVLLVGGLLAGCGTAASNDPTATTSGASSAGSVHNPQDVTFATQLIELEEQAITLLNVLNAKKDNPQFTQTVDGLVRTANERIVQAYGWLKEWNAGTADVPLAPGLLTPQQTDAVIISNGPQLQAAVEVALASQVTGLQSISRSELDAGRNPSARQLAQSLQANAESELAPLRQP